MKKNVLMNSTRFLLGIFTSMTLLVTPTGAAADQYGDYLNECCEETCPCPCDPCDAGWGNKFWTIGGAALVGAAAGAATGAAVSNSKHNGDRGATGPTGPSGANFPPLEQALTFNILADLFVGEQSISPTTLRFTPIVTTPAGETFLGTSEIGTDFLPDISFTVVVPQSSAVTGSYSVGYLITLDSNPQFAEFQIQFSGTVQVTVGSDTLNGTIQDQFEPLSAFVAGQVFTVVTTIDIKN